MPGSNRIHWFQRWAILILTFLVPVYTVSSEDSETGWPSAGDIVPMIVEGTPNVSVYEEMVYFSGQPSAESFSTFAELGVMRVINLRSEKEMAGLGFDEQELAENVGMRYVNIDVTQKGVGDTMILAVLDELSDASGETTLIHCAGSVRVGFIWSIYRAVNNGLPITDAIVEGKEAGLASSSLERRAHTFIVASVGGIEPQVAAPSHQREKLYRLAIFLTLFGLFAIWEVITPRRKRVGSKPVRWFSNFTLVGMNTLLVPLIVPIVALAMASLASDRGWGLLNIYEVPYPVAVVLSVIILDFIIYLQHIMFHAVPILWRLHRVHHSDVDLDVTSGTRFHFIEVLISMMIKVGAVALLGAPVFAVLLFEILLNATAMFNHANIRLPLRVDRILRLFIVTPDMHRVHHSVINEELNTNFGFNLPWWDYICGTYRAQPVQGHDGMTIGVDRFRSSRDQYPDRLLVQPFITGVPEIETERSGETCDPS